MIHLGYLRRAAYRFTPNGTLADDLVQETVVRALSHWEQFRPGTDLRAWLVTILRNCYFTEERRRKRITSLDPEIIQSMMAIGPSQDWHLHMRDFERAFSTLPADRRAALIHVGVSGCSYDEAAKIAGCAVGTMKSRVSRTRRLLKAFLERGTDDRPRRSGNWNIHRPERERPQAIEPLSASDRTPAPQGRRPKPDQASVPHVMIQLAAAAIVAGLSIGCANAGMPAVGAQTTLWALTQPNEFGWPAIFMCRRQVSDAKPFVASANDPVDMNRRLQAAGIQPASCRGGFTIRSIQPVIGKLDEIEGRLE